MSVQFLAALSGDMGRIFFVNPAAISAFGWTASELTGQPLTMAIPDFRLAEHASLAELTGRRTDGTEFFRIAAPPPVAAFSIRPAQPRSLAVSLDSVADFS